MNGPSLRRWLESFSRIIDRLDGKMPLEELTSLRAKFSPLVNALSQIVDIGFRTSIQPDAERRIFAQACDDYGIAAHAFGMELIIKEHIIVDHLADFMDLYGTLGLMSEQGGESLHQKWKRFAARYRNIRKPEDRIAATARMMQIKQGAGRFARGKSRGAR